MKSELFALTQDYARRLDWDPFLRSAALLHGAAAPAVGVRAYCVSRQGLGMETEYVSFHPPHTTAVKIIPCGPGRVPSRDSWAGGSPGRRGNDSRRCRKPLQAEAGTRAHRITSNSTRPCLWTYS